MTARGRAGAGSRAADLADGTLAPGAKLGSEATTPDPIIVDRAFLAAAAAALALSLVAATGCGGPQRAPDGTPAASSPPAGDPRTPIERRRDAACDQLGPKLTACAVGDTRADFAAGKIDQREFERDTAPEWQDKLTAKWLADCKGARYSSRQIRVLEVCFREEIECGPLVQCLDHLHDRIRGNRGN